LPEHTLQLPQSALPQDRLEPEFAVDADRGEYSSVTVGPAGISVHEMLQRPVGVEGYTSGYASEAPQWPVRHKGPDKRTALAAVIGLATCIVALIIVVALIGNSVQAALTNSGGRSGAPGASLPTTTVGLPTSTVLGSNSGLVVTPTQVALDCQSNQDMTLQLTNTQSSQVSWQAQTSSSHHSGVSIDPSNGSLDASETQSITVSINSDHSGDGQGTIDFTVTSGQQDGNQQATTPIQVNYPGTSCGGGGGGGGGGG
jgi:hypothetical protein